MNFIVGFLMVILYMLFIRFGLLYKNEFTYYLFQVIGTTASINIGLGIFESDSDSTTGWLQDSNGNL